MTLFILFHEYPKADNGVYFSVLIVLSPLYTNVLCSVDYFYHVYIFTEMYLAYENKNL